MLSLSVEKENKSFPFFINRFLTVALQFKKKSNLENSHYPNPSVHLERMSPD